jgi:hypothetical protein
MRCNIICCGKNLCPHIILQVPHEYGVSGATLCKNGVRVRVCHQSAVTRQSSTSMRHIKFVTSRPFSFLSFSLLLYSPSSSLKYHHVQQGSSDISSTKKTLMGHVSYNLYWSLVTWTEYI